MADDLHEDIRGNWPDDYRREGNRVEFASNVEPFLAGLALEARFVEGSMVVAARRAFERGS
jgi:hypothetical protein